MSALTGPLGHTGIEPLEGFDPYHNVIGQSFAVDLLRSSAAAPVHAYLLVGPSGSGARELALAFAADVLSRGFTGPAADRAVGLALVGRHPDLVLVGADATALRRAEAERLRQAASRSPLEGPRKVLIGVGFDVIQPEAAALLLKTIEEPGESTIFVLLAEDVPPDLVTIASRCVRVDLAPLSTAEIARALEAENAGWSDDQIAQAAEAAEGDLARARLLASDARFGVRQAAWSALPDQLDGTGATVHRITEDLLTLIDEAVAPLEAQHAAEREAQAAEAEEYGSAKAPQRETADRQRRQVRRFREGELRAGLRLVARQYRNAALESRLPLADAAGAVRAIDDLAGEMVRHPNERLQLQALLLTLPRLAEPAATPAS